jgi:hypothetical protein
MFNKKRRDLIMLLGGRGSVATGGCKLGETSASPLNHLRRPCRAAPA